MYDFFENGRVSSFDGGSEHNSCKNLRQLETSSSEYLGGIKLESWIKSYLLFMDPSMGDPSLTMFKSINTVLLDEVIFLF